MKRAIWAEEAIDDLHAIEEYLAEYYGDAFGRHVVTTLIGAGRWLLDHPNIGSPLSVDGWRKWGPRKSRHILIYRVIPGGIEVLRVRHERNDWRPVPRD
jgi:toxin ParE1/3/4